MQENKSNFSTIMYAFFGEGVRNIFITTYYNSPCASNTNERRPIAYV